VLALFKSRFLLAGLLIVLAGVLAICFAPFAVSNGVRLWIWWKARQQKLTVKIDKVEAPFLRPVLLRGFHLASARDAAFRVDLNAAQAKVDLNLRAILMGMRGRALHALSVKDLRVEMHRNRAGGAVSENGWNTLQRLLPDNFNFERCDLRVEDESTVILFRNVSLSANQIEAGRFHAGEVMIASPSLRQTFSELRGATNWQGDRLTLAGLSLTRGLDVQSITSDLSRLGKQRIGLEFDLDAFGGKIRARISNEWHSPHSNWNLAGSATDISLAQTSEALGFTDRIGGLLHACKFTFRGNRRDPMRATASLWTELTGLTWRGRTADVIMLGAALYHRQIQLQQLYAKQSKNQLTLSGEAAFPTNSSDWLSPDFRGDISASISDLGDFASLFGANPGDFAGEIAIEGTMDARDRKIGGHVIMGGTSLILFKTSIDALNARLNLKAMELEIEQFEANRKSDFIRAQGRIDMSHEHSYSGTLSAAISNVADYLAITGGTLTADPKTTSAETQITIDSGVWDARGAISIPKSSPLNFAAQFSLRIGKDWNTFLTSPLNATLDFPAIFIANAPRYFHSEIFRDGILSGKISLSETLQHPRLVGDLQLVNGKLQGAPMNLTETSGRVTFNGERATIDFFNAATKDADLSFRGEIDLHDANDLTIRMSGMTPIFDLSHREIDCVGQIGFIPVGLSLAPAIGEIELRGGLFRTDWTVSLKESGIGQSSGALNLAETTRKLSLCFGTGTEEKSLTLGVQPRPNPETVRPRKKLKHR
jgi:hypothetical protein